MLDSKLLNHLELMVYLLWILPVILNISRRIFIEDVLKIDCCVVALTESHFIFEIYAPLVLSLLCVRVIDFLKMLSSVRKNNKGRRRN
ncbi:hypothetical protein JHK84_029531 [Glycine max]|nr:hypothetical protein JHK87_029198 [Glycine soja]KAG5153059.1 hypothetical protein JHK84_029531 [Glycine max]